MLSKLPKYDLHSHSTASDGSLAPADLVARAQERGVEVLALTDHDTLAGVKTLVKAPPTDDVKIIAGVEFTCLLGKQVLHIVGLGLDVDNSELNHYLQQLESIRRERGIEICRRLVRVGIDEEPLLAAVNKAVEKGVVGRPHIAQALVDLGLVKSIQAGFDKYLGAGKKAYVKIAWPELSETLAIIKGAGGYAVFAHPTKYKMTFTKIRTSIAVFAELGGDAIEVAYNGIALGQQTELERLAKTHNLSISAGSDFHNPAYGWIDLGKFPKVLNPETHILHQLLSDCS